MALWGLYADHTKAKPIIRMVIRASDLNLIPLIDSDVTLPGSQVIDSLDLQTLLQAHLGWTAGGNGNGQVGIDGRAGDTGSAHHVISSRIHPPKSRSQS